MAYDALNEGGQLVICEPFKDTNEDLILIWEFRYMFWDDFGKACFKPIDLYQSILKEVGFDNIQLSAIDTEGVDRIMKAVKSEKILYI